MTFTDGLNQPKAVQLKNTTIQKLLVHGQGVFIFHNKKDALYFSSCTLRDKFSTFKNITHKSIWKSINFLKNLNCEKFYLGTTKTLFSKKNIDQKRKNIERFKSSFGGEENFFAIFEEETNNKKV